MTGGQTTNHEQPGRQARETAAKTQLATDFDQSAQGALTRCTLGLVDLGEHSVRRLGNDSGAETGEKTGSEIDTGLGAVGELGLVGVAEDDFGDLLEGSELRHGVRDSVNVIESGNDFEGGKELRKGHTA